MFFFNNLPLKEYIEAFSISTLILIIFKCLFGQINPLYNVLLLIGLSIINYNLQSYIYFQEVLVIVLRKTVPKYFLEIRDVTLKELYNEWKGLESEQKIIKKQMEFNKFELCALMIFHLLIYIRLIILAEPLIYGIIYSSIIYFLIFNKFIFITYILSLIIIISKLCFTLNTKTYINMLEKLQLLANENLLDENINLKANIRNTIIISHFILGSINELYWQMYKNKMDIDMNFIIILIEDTLFLTFISKFAPKNLEIQTRKPFLSLLFKHT